MGAGASVGLVVAVGNAGDDELLSVVAGLPAESIAKLNIAVKSSNSATRPDVRLFMANQITQLASAIWPEWIGTEPDSMKASMPPFNIRDVPLPSAMELFNVPVFGWKITGNTLGIVDGPEWQLLADELCIKIPKWALDEFLQKKIKLVRLVTETARSRDDFSANLDAVQRLESFVSAFETLSPSCISDAAGWSQWMAKFVCDDWVDKLHFNDVLTCFGFLPETNIALLNHVVEVKSDTGTKRMKLQDRSIRWLSKAMVGFKPTGCLTDVANLVFAMMSVSSEGMSENEIADTISRFALQLKRGDMTGLWIPTHLIQDGESDDTLTWLILEHISRLTGSPFYMLGQLPLNRALNAKAERIASLRNVTIFRDPDSKNAKAVMQNFGINEEDIARPDPSTVRFLMCGQYTKLVNQTWPEWLGTEPTSIKASAPAFNFRDIPYPAGTVALNVPVAGWELPIAIMHIFRNYEIKQIAAKYNVPIPEWTFDTEVHNHIDKVQLIIDAARARDDFAANKAAVERLASFVIAFKALDKSSAAAADEINWRRWIGCHVLEGWEDMLAFEDVLLSFGFLSETNAALLEATCDVEQDGVVQATSLQDHAMCWLSRAIAGFAPKTCLTDVANLAFAMTGASPEGMSESEIIDKINQFSLQVRTGALGCLWIPTHVLYDGGSDDVLADILLEHITRAEGVSIKKLVQLPLERTLNSKAEMIDDWKDVTVIRDPDYRVANSDILYRADVALFATPHHEYNSEAHVSESKTFAVIGGERGVFSQPVGAARS